MLYLDNSATTPLAPEVRKAMAEAYDEVWGNPSSLHSAGNAAERLLTESRRAVLEAMGIRNLPAVQLNRLIFTGSGTEANNIALFGTAHAKPSCRGMRIVTTPDQHPSVSEPLRRLEAEGFEVVRISVEGGALDMAELEAALDSRTLLLSIMGVNNETGAAYDAAGAFALARRINPEIITHTDAVQSFLKLPDPSGYQPDRLNADLMTVSAHKLNGPKGVGALYISERLLTGKRIAPIMFGGGQEFGFRSGTENVAGAAGFAAACGLPRSPEAAAAARSKIIALLAERAPGVAVNQPAAAAPHILSLTLPDVQSETMVHFLSQSDIYVSGGSACSSRSRKVSESLTAFGLSPREAARTIRVSLPVGAGSEALTDAGCEAFADALAAGLARLYKR